MLFLAKISYYIIIYTKTPIFTKLSKILQKDQKMNNIQISPHINKQLITKNYIIKQS